MIVPVRLNEDELVMLDMIRCSEDRGNLNRSEMLRLLIHREHLRRTAGRSKIPTRVVSSDFRVGRPRKRREPE